MGSVRPDRSLADRMRGPLERFLGRDPAVSIRWWDGSEIGSPTGETVVAVNSPNALRRILFAPGELGFARAYVAGDIDIEGSVFDVLALRDALGPTTEHVRVKLAPRIWLELAAAARAVGALGRPPAPPPEEARLRGPLHSRSRDRAAISHHYDVSNDFYRLVLGPSMTYSCAYFARGEVGLDQAQADKHELVCRKLRLAPGMRLLDVGCGWGGMLLHAAQHHGVRAVGITLSQPQADLASKRVADAGLADRIEVRLQDYRDVTDGPFDAIGSIGMFEHVGSKMLGAYFGTLRGLLTDEGRLLNHAISRPSGKAGFDRNSFISRYVFPDGELQEVGSVVTAMQGHGFEVRDVESLREHYALTLRGWVANLEANWDEAVRIVGENRARVWRLYMAGSAVGFEAGRINIHQTLGVRSGPTGRSGVPLTRDYMLGN